MTSFNSLICFQLGTTARRIQRHFNHRYQEYGITSSQSFILFALMENNGLNVKQLASRLELDSPAVTGLLDRMEREDIVERRSDPDDRRALKVYLTSKGQELAETVTNIPFLFNERIKLLMTDEQYEAFQGTLKLINSKL